MNGDVMFGIRSDIDSLQSTQHPYLLTVQLRELVIEILEEQWESDLAQLQFMQRNGINQSFPQAICFGTSCGICLSSIARTINEHQ